MAEPTPAFAHFLADHYAAIKEQHPGEGRRRWRLRAADQFFASSAEVKAEYAARAGAVDVENAEFVVDEDVCDALSGNAPGLGILVRADYSDEAAWQAFYAKLQEAEAEFKAVAEPEAGPSTDEPMSTDAPSSGAEQDEDMDEDEDEDGDEDEDEPSQIIWVLSASPAAILYNTLTDITNLRALRLLTDVNVRRAPPRPLDAPKARPHRLVALDGWQEVYAGKTVWVYDERSNADGCARLVSPQGDAYGTATGDSWRARVSHVCELQMNLATGALRIDFGGVDRWDQGERARNLKFAEARGG